MVLNLGFQDRSICERDALLHVCSAEVALVKGLDDMQRLSFLASAVILGIFGITAAAGLSGCKRLGFSQADQVSNDQFLALFDKDNRVANAPVNIKQASPSQLDGLNGQIAKTGMSVKTPQEAIQCIDRFNSLPVQVQEANQTNYGKRLELDKAGNPVHSRPLFIVFHETVTSEEKTLNYFRTPHANDADQASYHMLVSRNGRKVRIVDDSQRAFGAGQSSFRDFTVKINPDGPGSLNNVALHIGLVSPSDGRGDSDSHSGYTVEQYNALALQTLAWQLEHQISSNRITTHKAIDQSGTRRDPRSFDWPKFREIWRSYAQQCNALAYTEDQESRSTSKAKQ
jgi:N-acetyl-anhydromuramyl-L-alanine amidase AmpD